VSTFDLKDGNGTAFTNKKRSEEKHPTHTGEIKINGKLHWLDIWVKKTKAGDNYFSIRIGNEKKPKSENNDDYQRPVMDNTKAGGYVDLDDSVPFKAEVR
jgi:hypothetical protein